MDIVWIDAVAVVLAVLLPCSAATVPDATAQPTLTPLYNFPGGRGGGFLEGGLVRNPATSVLYGTTAEGGTHGWGMVFSLTPPATAGKSWTQTMLYSF